MTARLSHRASRRGDIIVRVLFGDGRANEDFRVQPRELVRFAWSVLADYQPEEAALAAAEDGVDLTPLAVAAPHRRGPGRYPRATMSAPLIQPQEDSLLALRDGPLPTRALAPHCGKRTANNVLHSLQRRQLVVATPAPRAGQTNVWSLTEAGRRQADQIAQARLDAAATDHARAAA